MKNIYRIQGNDVHQCKSIELETTLSSNSDDPTFTPLSFNYRVTRIKAEVFPALGASARPIIVILFLIGQSCLSRFTILEGRDYILQPILSLVQSSSIIEVYYIY